MSPEGNEEEPQQPRFVQLGRTIDDEGIGWTDEAAIELLAGMDLDRLHRCVNEALARHELRISFEEFAHWEPGP